MFRFLFILLFLPFTALGASSDWFTTEQGKLRLLTASPTQIAVEFSLEPGWKIYWRSSGDAGAPTQIDTRQLSNLAASQIKWPIPHRHIDPITEDMFIQTFVYGDHVIFPITLTPKDSNMSINGMIPVSFAICKEICLFYDTAFDVAIAPNYLDSATQARIEAVTLPTAEHEDLALRGHMLYQAQEGEYQLEVNAYASEWKKADLLIEGTETERFLTPVITPMPHGVQRFLIPIDSAEDASLANRQLTLTLINGDTAIEQTIQTGKAVSAPALTPTIEQSAPSSPLMGSSLWVMLLYGLIGGLILNVMPCVLPVLALKILGIVKHGGKALSHARGSLLFSSAGIVSSFLVLAAITLSLKEAGKAVGWGIHFQNPYVVISLLILVLLFAANLLGRFEIRMPGWLGNIALSRTKSHEGTALGHFLTGAFAAILATPCTAPFLGLAVSFALLHGTVEIISIFMAMGIGMALPYLFFASFPHLVTWLPKPGGWMVKVKYFLAFLLLLTAAWLIWVINGQLGFWPAILLLLLGLLLPFWLERVSGVKGFILALLTAFLMLYMPLEFSRRDNHYQKHMVDAVWKPFAPEAIDQLVGEGKIVVIDVTADWCLTCKTNKLLVLDRKDVLERLRQADIVAMRADMTNPDPVIAGFLKSHERYGIPFNVVYGKKAPEGIALPPLLTREALFGAIDKAGG